jgi:hypothetical protein
MKGETVEAYGVWRGNPAKPHRRLEPVEAEPVRQSQGGVAVPA